MRCVFFLQTSNLHPNKQKYKSEKETTLFLLYKIIIKTENTLKKKIKDKSSLKKLKHEPNIVEITHLCIRHGVQTSVKIFKIQVNA
jgi:hypothetical protein